VSVLSEPEPETSHQPCLPGDRHRLLPYQNTLEMALQTPLPAPLTIVMLSGAHPMLASTCCSLGCAGPQGPWKNFVIFGKRGTHLFSPLSYLLLNASFRASIEEDYAKRLSKLAKLTLGRDEIGCVPFWASPYNNMQVDMPRQANFETRSIHFDKRRTSNLSSIYILQSKFEASSKIPSLRLSPVRHIIGKALRLR
jgi:hypothetical protein